MGVLMLKRYSLLVAGLFAGLIFFNTLAHADSYDDYPISYGNWEGVCDRYSCVARNNRNVVINFYSDGDMWVQFPVPKDKLKGAGKLKTLLPDGTSYEEWIRSGIGQTLRLTVPAAHQKQFVKTRKFKVEGIGEFDIRNFAGLYEMGAFRLGINE